MNSLTILLVANIQFDHFLLYVCVSVCEIPFVGVCDASSGRMGAPTYMLPKQC